MARDTRIPGRRRRFLLAAAAVPVTGFATLAFLPAGAAPAFSGVAAAEGIRITLAATGGPATNTPVDSGGPVAQAALDSLGSSTAFASHVYPGDAAVSGPGAVAGVSNGAVNLPGYPLIAQSDAATTPESNVAGAGASLRARSSADRSEAEASTGGFDSSSARFGSAVARALVGRTGAGPRALSSNDVHGFAVGPLVLGHVRSVADVALADDGTMSRASELRVTGASIAGTAVEIGPDGVRSGPSTTPLPAAPIGDQLRQAGIELSYLEPEEGDGGITAAGLLVTVEQPAPGPVTPVGIRYLIGRASARLGSAGPSIHLPGITDPGSDPSAPPPDPGPEGPSVSAPPPAAQPAPPLSAPPEGPALGLVPAGPSPDESSSGAGGPPADEAAPAGHGNGAVEASRAATTRAAGLFDTELFYLVVAAGGVLAAATIRTIGQAGK